MDSLGHISDRLRDVPNRVAVVFLNVIFTN
jgi:hypothetical protein